MSQPNAAAAHGTLRGYLIGFALSVVLTAIPFATVMQGSLGGKAAALVAVFAAVQMVVHMVYFLHLTPKTEGGWSILALIFTLIMLVITLSGSLWVMYHLNTNMMPGHEAPMHDMSQMP
jgi:cytochrome o ubiquinol oxidase operon protein cyoD